MFYTMDSDPRFTLKDEGFIYHFNYKDVHYYEDGVFIDEPKGLVLFYPTAKDASALAKEYKAWCKEFEQPENAQLLAELKDVQYFAGKKGQDVEAASALFEAGLNKDMFFVSSLGFRCNGDRRTRANLQDLITFFDVQQEGGTLKYRDYDDNYQALSKEQLETLFAELTANGQNLYAQKWAKQEALTAAKHLDDVAAITPDFEMLDFSGKEVKAVRA